MQFSAIQCNPMQINAIGNRWSRPSVPLVPLQFNAMQFDSIQFTTNSNDNNNITNNNNNGVIIIIIIIIIVSVIIHYYEYYCYYS